MIECKGCVYDGEEANTTDISNFLESRMVEVLPSINDSDDASESSEEEDVSSDLQILSLSTNTLQLHFGYTIAGPCYSDVLLSIVRHNYNWRMSRKNRPNFPQIMHYEGELIDRINILYESLYGYPKHKHWQTYNESLPIVPAYGFVPVSKEYSSLFHAADNDKTKLSKNYMLQYLSDRQESSIPFLPIRGKNERQVAHKQLNEIVANQKSLTNHTVFEEICKHRNTHEISPANKIFPKLPYHFIRYVKSWRKNQDRRDAEISSGAKKINAALEHVPQTEIM